MEARKHETVTAREGNLPAASSLFPRATIRALNQALPFRAGTAPLAVALLFILAASALAADVYFPLASGMEWIYDFQVISPKGATNNGVLHRKIGVTVQ